MRLNAPVHVPPIVTHEGGPAVRIDSLAQLRRSVMACMLWEDEFYENGVAIAQRIADTIKLCDPTDVMNVALEARHRFKLRHVPLLIAREMARLPDHRKLVGHTLEQVVDRPDELAEFLAIYWKDGRQPLAWQVKQGLKRAFAKFNEYSLAKYNRDGAIKLRDVLFLVHGKPADAKGVGRKVEPIAKRGYHRGEVRRHANSVYTRLVEGTLATPDTWEVALSAGADKRATFERLIADEKLGALALLRNLRNMKEAGVEKPIVAQALLDMRVERVLPFRFIAAARAVPEWEDVIEPAMLKCLELTPKIAGRTLLLEDVSGSMDEKISAKSDLLRVDAACGLAILLREICTDVAVWTFSDRVLAVPPRRGFALRDAIVGSQEHSGTYLGRAVEFIDKSESFDRLIVITDEQVHDAVRPPTSGQGYIINVASAQNGVGYGKWEHIDGWSEAVIDYIREIEAAE